MIAPLRLSTAVGPAEAGATLLDFLAGRFRYHDRPAWAARIAARAIRVDGQPAAPSTLLRAGMVVSYETLHREPDVDTAVEVLHETADLLFVAKPAGLPVHADGVFVRHTLVHALRARLGPHLQPAHRLDRETSGVLLVAKGKAAAKTAQLLFQRGEVEKRYLAIVRGRVSWSSIRLDAPLARDPASRVSIRRAPAAADTRDARPAVTEVSVLRRLRSSTLVAVVPRTGRTHQIRAHLAAAGHSLVGDVLYGRDDDVYLAWVRHVKGGGSADWPEGRDAPRHFLHACSLAIGSALGGGLVVEAPMPADMRDWIERDADGVDPSPPPSAAATAAVPGVHQPSTTWRRTPPATPAHA